MKLQSSAQFIPTPENVSLLIAVYGLEFTSFEQADSGIENCTLFVQTISGKFVLRVYRQLRKSDAEIQLELDFVNYLGGNDIPVALPLQKPDGGFIAHLKQNGDIWQAILMQYMSGEHPKTYTSELLAQLAIMQAKMHLLASSFPASNISRLTTLRESQFIKLLHAREKLEPRCQAFVTRAEAFSISLDASLPHGLCHLDFDSGNILVKNSEVTAVLDFDDLALAPYVVCLAYTLWDVAYDVGLSGVNSYLEIYENLRPLTLSERDIIATIMLFRHYAIGCKDVADGLMDETLLAKYLELEEAIQKYSFLLH